MCNNQVLLTFLACFAFINCRAQPISIPFSETIPTNLEDPYWEDIASYDFDGESNEFFATQSSFKESDVSFRLKMSCNSSSIYFLVSWEDDTIDYQQTDKSNSTIQRANGRRMDKMYLFDNLKIQLKNQEINYTSWWSLATSPYQWYSLRIKEDSGWISKDINVPAFTFKNQEKKIKILIQLNDNDLLSRLAESQNMDLNVILVDSDTPQISIEEKITGVKKYAFFTSKIILEDMQRDDP